MAREYAKIRADIWGDEDWRCVSAQAKLLYFMLLSHATLTYAGVADWRPNRLAPLLDESWARSDVEAYAAELESKHLIVTNDETEEVLIRSFIKHDGVMKQPRLAVAMAAAFTVISCSKIKSVVAFEVQKLRDEFPGLACWKDVRVQTVLDHSGFDLKSLGNGLPSVSGEFGSNVGQALVSPTNTKTKTSSKEDRPASKSKRGSRIPEDFQITDSMREWAAEEAPLVDLDQKLREFMDYWRGVPGKNGVKLDWVSTWRNDMRKKQGFAERDGKGRPDQRRRRINDYDDE